MVQRRAVLLVHAAKLVVVPAVAGHGDVLAVDLQRALHGAARDEVVEHVIAVVALHHAVQAVADWRLARGEHQVEAVLAVGAVGVHDVAAGTVLGQRRVLHVHVQLLGRHGRVALEHAVGQRHAVLVQHLLHGAAQARVGEDALLQRLLDGLGRNAVNETVGDITAGRHVCDGPVEGVGVAGVLLVQADAEEADERGVLPAVGGLEVRVVVPPLGHGRLVGQIVHRQVDGAHLSGPVGAQARQHEGLEHLGAGGGVVGDDGVDEALQAGLTLDDELRVHVTEPLLARHLERHVLGGEACLKQQEVAVSVPLGAGHLGAVLQRARRGDAVLSVLALLVAGLARLAKHRRLDGELEGLALVLGQALLRLARYLGIARGAGLRALALCLAERVGGSGGLARVHRASAGTGAGARSNSGLAIEWHVVTALAALAVVARRGGGRVRDVTAGGLLGGGGGSHWLRGRVDVDLHIFGLHNGLAVTSHNLLAGGGHDEM
mmetsp:Transcript_82609/g.168357  ORF Transcript_82609/g.168357 Transcript_82609/m.168357 type:complete len:491 (+) Transcript_82609:1933-3405(+)